MKTPRIVEYREDGKVWTAQLADDAPTGYEKILRDKLIKQAKYELYERPKQRKYIAKIKEAKAEIALAEKELVAQAEALLGFDLPLLKSYTIMAASNELVSKFPIFSNHEKSLILDLRLKLPKDSVKRYKAANTVMDNLIQDRKRDA